jgi:hypothetical protein
MAMQYDILLARTIVEGRGRCRTVREFLLV